MTAPERIWNALHLGKMAAYSEYQLTRHTDGAKEKYDHVVEEIDSAMSIHQAALVRITELEGALEEIVAEGTTVRDTPHAVWRLVERTNATARDVLAKGDG